MTATSHAELGEPDRLRLAPIEAPRPALAPAGAQRLLALQRTAGNRAVGRLLRAPVTPVPAARPPRPDPRWVAPEPDPELPWRTDQIVDAPYGPEWVGMRGLGTWTHANWEYFDQLGAAERARFLSQPLPATQLEFEYRIPDPQRPAIFRLRIDAVDWAGETVYEFKPAHLLEQGEAEALMYAREMDRFHTLPGGRTWKYCCITYDQDAVIEFAVRIGLFTRQSLGLNPLWSGRLWAYMDGPALPPATPVVTARPPSVTVNVPGTGTIADYMRPKSPIPAGGTALPFTPLQDAAAEPSAGVRAPGAGATAFTVITSVPSIVSTARDMRIESQKPVTLGPAILSDEGGDYTLSRQAGWLWNTYFKTYVTGPRAGETVELDWWEGRAEEQKRRAKYGYWDWKGEFIEGEVPPMYYSGELPGSA